MAMRSYLVLIVASTQSLSPSLVLESSSRVGFWRLLCGGNLLGEMEMPEEERAELARLERFVHGEDEFIPGRTGLTAYIWCSIDFSYLGMSSRTSVILTRKLFFFEDTDRLFKDTFTFIVKETMLLAFQVLVACPALIELHLCFFFLQFRSISDDDNMVLQVFSVLHRSRALHKLEIALIATKCEYIRHAKICGERLFGTHLPILLRDNRFLETLALKFEYCTAPMSYLFSRNSARLWKLWMYHFCKDFHFSCNPLEEFINLFQMMELSRMSDFTLKELVLSCSSSELVCESFHFAMANEFDMAYSNKQIWNKYQTEETAEVICCDLHLMPHDRHPKACKVLRVFEGTGAFSLAHTSLSTLKLDLPKTSRVIDSLTVLVTTEVNHHLEVCGIVSQVVENHPG